MKAFIAIVAVLAVASAAPKLEKSVEAVHPHPLPVINVPPLHVNEKSVEVVHPHPHPVIKPPTPHIIGGDEAKPHSVPYAALLQISGNAALVCAGTLLSENYVLTTAHCVDGADGVLVTLGAHKYREIEATQVFVVSENITIHKNYDSNTLSNDIAVIKLLKPVKLSDAIQPVALPSDSEDEYVGALATVSGWGISDLQVGTLSDVLNSVQLEVISNKACATYYGDFITSAVLCTAPKPNAGTCNGDSGSPLVSNGELIGITAFGGVDCVSSPAGFTRITSFLDFLKDNTDV